MIFIDKYQDRSLLRSSYENHTNPNNFLTLFSTRSMKSPSDGPRRYERTSMFLDENEKSTSMFNRSVELAQIKFRSNQK